MSHQSDTFYRLASHYLDGVDPTLGDLWRRMMRRAGYPQVSAAVALEAILADFQSGVTVVQEDE